MNEPQKLRVCAVSYLNTVPLVWGMLHGAQRGLFDLSFSVPSECAERLKSGDADIGIVPVIEIPRQRLAWLPGTGIACRGPVRSLLLISKTPLPAIRRLAADISSRTTVALTRVLLARRHGVRPEFVPMPPDLDTMLAEADAAIIIGDPALHLDPKSVPWQVVDVGEEWMQMTGLPMVFAVWAGRPEVIRPELAEVFQASCRYGLEHLDDIVAVESAARGMPAGLVRDYFTRNVVLELGEREYQGMNEFLRMAAEFEPASAAAPSP